MMATKDPKKILDDCLASAKEAIDSLEVDVLEVVEV